MRVSRDNGTYTIVCDQVELGLIAEGLYAVEDTGRRCVEANVPDEVDAAALRDELYLLGDMRAQIDAALD